MILERISFQTIIVTYFNNFVESKYQSVKHPPHNTIHSSVNILHVSYFIVLNIYIFRHLLVTPLSSINLTQLSLL